ncbi:MAG: hypothetical protein ACFE9C_16610, partial [Candidatus Hodarchaeota archaeon]
MGIFLITTWYPPHKTMDVAKMILKQPREIPFVTKWRVFNTTDGKDGMKQYHLIYTERGKLEEAGMGVYKYFSAFLTQIEGYYMKSESLIGVSDSYKMV